MGKGRTIVTLLLLAGGGACSVVTSYDGFGSSSGSNTATCGPRIPEKPTTGNTADDGMVHRAAMRSIRFAPTDGQTLGFDLDENCSKPACTSRRPGAEVKLGVDNVIGTLIGALLNAQEDKPFTDDALKAGTFGLFVELSKWNGQRNDPAVTVSLYNVVGVNAGGTKVAAFNGSDAYVVDSNQIKSGAFAGSTSQDLAAYVTNGTLVANFDSYPLRLIARTQKNASGGILTVTFTGASLVARVAAGSGGPQITDAQLVGRIVAPELLRDISRIGYCPAGIADAGTGAQYESNKALLCGILDLAATKGADGTTKKCEAASVAFGLDFAATSVAPVGGPAPEQLDECPGVSADTCP